MRPVRKPVETYVLSLFAKALAARGIPPIHAPEITDSPDALFAIDGVPVAIELRYASHPELLKLLAGPEWPPDTVYEVFLPLEPHLWVRDAIRDKNKHVQKYKSRTGAKESWLLLHSTGNQAIIRDDRPIGSEILELFRLGAYLETHAFDQIWLVEVVGPHEGAVPIFGPGIERPTVSAEAFVQARMPYPMDRYWFSNAVVKDDGKGGQKLVINTNNLAAKPVCLQPIDSRFSIDYPAILSVPNRNANLTGLNWSLFENAPKI